MLPGSKGWHQLCHEWTALNKFMLEASAGKIVEAKLSLFSTDKVLSMSVSWTLQEATLQRSLILVPLLLNRLQNMKIYDTTSM